MSAAEQEVGREARYTLLTVFLVGLRRRDPGAVVNAVVAAIGTYLPTDTITPALIDAVGRRTTDDDIDTYIDRHGIAGLATALTYTIDRERGEVTHRLMARDLDISPLVAEIILQALRPIVDKHFDIEEAGASVADIESVNRDITGDDT